MKTFTVDTLADVDSLPEPVRHDVRAIWTICCNTWCILTDHEFTAVEAQETLAQLLNQP